MSYNVEFYKDRKFTEERQSSDLNITSNLRDMFNWAYRTTYWVEAVEGLQGYDVARKTVKALERMILHPEEAKKFNSPNGLGIYEHAVKFLTEFAIECASKDKSLLYIRIDR